MISYSGEDLDPNILSSDGTDYGVRATGVCLAFISPSLGDRLYKSL